MVPSSIVSLGSYYTVESESYFMCVERLTQLEGPKNDVPVMLEEFIAAILSITPYLCL